jgi:thiamine-monophosphate kinase
LEALVFRSDSCFGGYAIRVSTTPNYPSMNEFDLIARYFGANPLNGDDAAVLNIPDGYQLAVSVDAMEESVHFFSTDNPHAIGYKLLAVNISDMAAMGATPRYITLSLGIPRIDATWLSGFSQGLHELATRYQIQLVGGDTCKSSHYHASIQIMGLVPHNSALTRHNAQAGDAIYVTGSLGEPALGLAIKQGKHDVQDIQAVRALEYPDPPLDFAVQARAWINAAIDISDGLLGDLGHIAKASKLTAVVDGEHLPLYSGLFALGDNIRYNYALSGGEEYQLCFTADPVNFSTLQNIANQTGVTLHRVGRMVYGNGEVKLHGIAKGYYPASGFQHFT